MLRDPTPRSPEPVRSARSDDRCSVNGWRISEALKPFESVLGLEIELSSEIRYSNRVRHRLLRYYVVSAVD